MKTSSINAIVHSGCGNARIISGYSISTETFEFYLNKLQVNEKALTSFFYTIQKKNIGPDFLDEELKSIADSYNRLRSELQKFQPLDSEVAALRSAAIELVNEGQLEAAGSKLEAAKALDQAALETTHSIIKARQESIVAVITTQATVAETQLNFSAAADAIREALDYMPEGASARVSLLIRLTEFERRAGHYNAALEVATNALSAMPRSAQIEAIEVLQLRSRAFRELGRYHEATKDIDSAVSELIQLPDPKLDLRRSLEIDRANLLRDQGDVIEAAVAFGALVKEAVKSEGNERLTAHLLQGKGRSLYDAADWEAARQAFETCLHIRLKIFPQLHPDILCAMQDLALALDKIGEKEQAEKLHKKSHAAFKVIFPPNHPYLITSCDNLAGFLLNIGKIDEAKKIYEDALEHAYKNLPNDHPDLAQLLQNYGTASLACGQLCEARSVFAKAYGIWELRGEGNHPDAATALHNLALTHLLERELEPAYKFCRSALDIRKVRRGMSHPETADSLSLLASVAHERQQFDIARQDYLLAKKIWLSSFGGLHDKLAQAEANLARLEIDVGNIASAITHALEAVRIAELVHNKPHPTTAIALNNLGHAEYLLGRFCSAARLFGRAVELRDLIHNEPHPETIVALNNLSVAAQQAGDFKTAKSSARRAAYLESTCSVSILRGNVA